VASHRRENGTFIGVADDTTGGIKRGDAVVFRKQDVFEIV
jgi:hypothetical protein